MATKPQRTRQLLFAMGTVAALSLSALVRDATAAIPASERQALIDLYNATGGASWTTRTNWRNAGNTDFSVSGTECTWYGVFCDSGGTKVQQLVLPLNHLVGTLPASLGSLTNLESLDMFSNQLTGSIPDLSNLATNLTALYLYSNQLSGSIPTSLGNLTNLTVLDLSSNQLTGAIPTALAYLTSLTFLDLSSNQLTGSITASLGSVTTLQRLLLKGNMLSGAIPTTLEYLTNLTAGDLDLRYNALYSTNATLTTFLNTAQSGGNWQSTQTVAPTGVATGTATSTSVALSWTPITYTADSGGYQVSYATVSGGPYTLSGTTADKTATGFTVTGLAAGTVYYFVVESVTYPNANNQNTVTSAPSAEVSATTSAGSCTAPSITSQPLGQSIQSGQTATVTVTASGTAPLSYQWYQGTSGDTSHLVGTNSSSFTTPLLTSTTSYWVRVSNSCGYVDSATAMVIVGVTYANFVWVPVASYAGGLDNSQWRSDLGLLNVDTVPANVQIAFYGTSGTLTNTTSVAAGAQSILTDVVEWLGGSGSGALEVGSDQPLKVTARTYNQVSSTASCYPDGTQGQDYPAVASSSGLGADQSAYLAGLTENASYRSNIGMVNTGTGNATVVVTLYDGEGAYLADYTVSLAAGQWSQATQPFKNDANQTAMGAGYAMITVQRGSGVFGFASVIDNITNDPTTVAMQESASALVVWVPVASHTTGLNQSQWRSDLGLLNNSLFGPDTMTPANVQIAFYGTSGTVTNTTTVAVGAQSILTDVVGQLGGTGSGALKV
ncbi:MAG: leucine-rich repeat domain-containing protein, partial [Thermoanaerobaculaceae bacterium]